MSTAPITLVTDLWVHIPKYCDRLALVTLRLAAKIFAESETIYEQLFARRCPHLTITLPPSTWKELYLSRCQAEQNMLNGLYQIKTLFTFPARASNQEILTFSQGRQLVTYRLGKSLEIQDLHKTRSLFLPVDPAAQLFYQIQECNHQLYLLISTSSTLTIYQIKNTLAKIASYSCKEIATSLRLIPSTNSHSFWIAATFGTVALPSPILPTTELKIWHHNSQDPVSSTPTTMPLSRVPEDEDAEVDDQMQLSERAFKPTILQSYSENENHFIVVKLGLKIAIYNICTLQKSMTLNLDSLTASAPQIDAKILQTDQSTILMIVHYNKGWIYEMPKPSDQHQNLFPIFIADQLTTHDYPMWENSDFVYIKGNPGFLSNYYPNLVSRTYNVCIHSLSPGHQIQTASKKDISLQNYHDVKISEPNGLPILLLNNDKEVKTASFNFTPPPSPLEKWGKLIRTISLIALGLFFAYHAKTLLRLFSSLRSRLTPH